MSEFSHTAVDVESHVQQRYSRGAQSVEAGLCCPGSYDSRYLDAIPQEVLDRDYGCGDPTRGLQAGETVLDLGSGAGKLCFIASQIVGPAGKVIGVDMTDDMLAVARKNAPQVAQRIGYSNVEFKKGKIQDLALDLEALDLWLKDHPVRGVDDFTAMQSHIEEMRASRPLVETGSIDVVLSSCVLNLVKPSAKKDLFAEIYRVLRRGGRAIISDIVSDEDVPAYLQADPDLWSGCIAGSLREDKFLQAFEDAGFYGISILERHRDPWRTVDGIEFRSLTVAAYKGKEGECWDHKQAVIYKGPFRQVVDDDGHSLRRGMRVAVCQKTFDIYSREPYASYFDLVEPLFPESIKAQPFPCANGMLLRNPKETKGENYAVTTSADASCCSNNGGCC